MIFRIQKAYYYEMYKRNKGNKNEYFTLTVPFECHTLYLALSRQSTGFISAQLNVAP